MQLVLFTTEACYTIRVHDKAKLFCRGKLPFW